MPGPQIIPRPIGWRPGRPAPWAHLPVRTRTGLDVALAERRLAPLAAVPPPQAAAPAPGALHVPHPLELDLERLRPAAVLVALFDEGGEAHVVLTRRASTLRSHTHQVAFPGGRLDPGETPWEAARREAFEEVGIPLDTPRHVADLPPLATLAGGSAVRPIVGVLPARPVLVPSPAEVERAFTVPLAHLVADGVHHEERWDLPALPDRPIHFFDLDEDLVWGATARILVGLLALVLGVADDELQRPAAG